MSGYIVLHTDGTVTSASPEAGESFFKFLYGQIGCRTVAPVTVGDLTLWVDEDGGPMGSPVNPVASAVSGQHLVGVVVMAAGGRGGEKMFDDAVITQINTALSAFQA